MFGLEMREMLMIGGGVLVGLVVIVAGMSMTGAVLTQAITKAMSIVERFCATPIP